MNFAIFHGILFAEHLGVITSIMLSVYTLYLSKQRTNIAGTCSKIFKVNNKRTSDSCLTLGKIFKFNPFHGKVSFNIPENMTLPGILEDTSGMKFNGFYSKRCALIQFEFSANNHLEQ